MCHGGRRVKNLWPGVGCITDHKCTTWGQTMSRIKTKFITFFNKCWGGTLKCASWRCPQWISCGDPFCTSPWVQSTIDCVLAHVLKPPLHYSSSQRAWPCNEFWELILWVDKVFVQSSKLLRILMKALNSLSNRKVAMLRMRYPRGTLTKQRSIHEKECLIAYWLGAHKMKAQLSTFLSYLTEDAQILTQSWSKKSRAYHSRSTWDPSRRCLSIVSLVISSGSQVEISIKWVYNKEIWEDKVALMWHHLLYLFKDSIWSWTLV